MKNTARGMALPCLIICLMLLQSQRILAENYQVPVKIGDKIPSIELKVDKKKILSFNDFKGKAVIIDFFATYCGPCVAALPHLNRLQKKYKNQLQIIIVTKESKEQIDKALPRFKQLTENMLPLVCSDTVLNKMFPHLSIPHEIWLSKDGIVKAITEAKFVNTNNIESLINDIPLTLPEKIDFLNYDESKVLSENLNNAERKPRIVYKSIFSTYLPGAITVGKLKKENETITISIVNFRILEMYKLILDPKYWAGRVIVKTKDSSRFFPLLYIDKDWNSENTYCYQLTMPVSTTENQRIKIMMNDFNTHFNLQMRTEIKAVKCWALRIVNDKVFKKSLAQDVNSAPKSYSKERSTINSIVTSLNTAANIQCDAPIVINQVESDHQVNFKIPNNLLPSIFPAVPINDIQVFLRKKGLDLIPVETLLEVAVISDDDEN